MKTMRICCWIGLVAISLVSLGAAVGCARLRPAPETPVTGFSFAFISDTHIISTDPASPQGENAVRLTKALEEIARRPEVEFIIHGGDAIENPGNADQLAAFDSLMKPQIPWYPIVGNHDIGNLADAGKVQLWLARGYGRGSAQHEYYGFVHRGAAFFILNTFAAGSTDPEVRRRADDQLLEMDRFFASNAKAANKIVCGHAPPFIRYADEPDEYFNIPIAYRTRILDVMARHGVETYLSGHRHLEATVHDSSGITVLSQTSLAFAIGEPKLLGFSVFTVSESGVSKEFVSVEPVIPAAAK